MTLYLYTCNTHVLDLQAELNRNVNRGGGLVELASQEVTSSSGGGENTGGITEGAQHNITTQLTNQDAPHDPTSAATAPRYAGYFVYLSGHVNFLFT